jgi:hypothetical protein
VDQTENELLSQRAANISTYSQLLPFFGLCPSSGIIKTMVNRMFRKEDLFPSSGEGGTPALLGPLERVILSQIMIEFSLLN